MTAPTPTDPAADRAQRTGAHLLAKARSFGWLDDGEGAVEFLIRRAYEQGRADADLTTGDLLGVGFDTGLVTITMHSAGTFSGRYRDVLRDRAGLIGNVDLDTLLDWLRSRLS